MVNLLTSHLLNLLLSPEDKNILLYMVTLSLIGPVYLLDSQPARLSPKESNTGGPY